MSDILQVSQSWLPVSLFSRESGKNQVFTYRMLTPPIASSSLQRELEGLRLLEHQMARNFNAIKRQFEEQEYSRTWKGKLWLLCGKFFALYCVIRVISVRIVPSKVFYVLERCTVHPQSPFRGSDK